MSKRIRTNLNQALNAVVKKQRQESDAEFNATLNSDTPSEWGTPSEWDKYEGQSLFCPDSDLIPKTNKARLPNKSEDRKKIPLASVLDYFPDALCAVAEVVNVGQVQHSTDRWDRSKSTDHEDCLLRHLLDRGTVDTDGMRHSAKVAWRALALLQLEIEKDKGLPPSRGSK